MRFAILGSGSSGNALVVESGRSRVLVDCGFGIRETTARLQRLGLEPEALSAVFITHEHGDHSGGAVAFARRYRLPLWLSHGTFRAMGEPDRCDIHLLEVGAPLSVGGLEVLPYPICHDAREGVQYRFSDGARHLGILTDSGGVSEHMAAVLAGCDALVLECNHDETMLRQGPYPYRLKQRVAGPWGHLSNRAAADFLATLAGQRLTHVVAAHLSTTNNRPELAVEALAGALGCSLDWIAIADQDLGLDWRQLG